MYPYSSMKTRSIVCGCTKNMHFADQGAYTGEISPLMVKDTGAVLVELGHSERRRYYFAETDLMVNKKVHAAINHGLKPLVCVGDEAQEKEWGVSVETVVRQMKAAIAGLSAAQVATQPVGAHTLSAARLEFILMASNRDGCRYRPPPALQA